MRIRIPSDYRTGLVACIQDHVARMSFPRTTRRGFRVRVGPPQRTWDPMSREHERLHRPHRDTVHRSHEGEVSSLDPVIDEGGSSDEAYGHPHDCRRDPEPRDPLPQNEPLCIEGFRDRWRGGRNTGGD